MTDLVSSNQFQFDGLSEVVPQEKKEFKSITDFVGKFRLSHEVTWILSNSLDEEYHLYFLRGWCLELNINLDKLVDTVGAHTVQENFWRIQESIPIKVRNKVFYRFMFILYLEFFHWVAPGTSGESLKDNSVENLLKVYKNKLNKLFEFLKKESEILEYKMDVLLIEEYNNRFDEGSRVLQGIRDFDLNAKDKSISNRFKKKQKKVFKRRLNKSIDITKRFLGEENTKCIIKGDCFKIESEETLFYYIVKSGGTRNIVNKTKKFIKSIPYDLEIYQKETDIKIAKTCIYFDSTPILDQILSVYLMIKNGKEMDLLSTGNFYGITKEGSKILTSHGFLNSSMFSVGNIPVTEVQHQRELEWKQNFRKVCEKYTIDYFGTEINRFLSNLDVSWDEAVDYYAFPAHNVECFDRLVKGIKHERNRIVTKR